MEDDEKEHISSNLLDLMKFTFCTITLVTYLQQENILSEYDVQDVMVSSSTCFAFNKM